MIPPTVQIADAAPPSAPAPKPAVERDLITTLFALGLLVFLYQALSAGHLWAVGWVVLGALALFLKRRAKARFVLLLELPVLIGLLAYSATAIYLVGERQAFDFINDPFAAEGAWIALGGMTCFVAGLALAVLRGAEFWQPAAAAPITLTIRQVLIIYLVGLISAEGVARVAPIWLMAIAYTFGLCQPLALFIYLKLAMDAKPRWVGTPRFYLWMAALGIWSVRSVMGGIFGSTLLILTVFVTQQIHRSYIFVAAGLFFLATVAPLIQDTKSDYRQRLAGGVHTSERALQDVVAENFRHILSEGDMETYRKGMTQLAERVCTFEIWLRVKRHMDTLQDFAKGQTILDALVFGFIPRFLWPDKPVTGGVNMLAEKYADMTIAEGTSVGVGMISEFYINGGTWAVLLGMLGIGALGGAALMRGWFDNVQPLGLMGGILAFSLLVRPEANLNDVLGGFIRILFLWWALRFWIVRGQRRARPEPSPLAQPIPPWNPPPA